MKRTLLFLFCALMSVQMFSESGPLYADYYWYNGNKIYLERGNQEYIIYNNALLLESDKRKLSHTDVIFPSYPEHPNLMWGTTEPNAVIDDVAHVLYQTPSYKRDEEGDIFVTHRFYVKLKDGEDLSVLQNMAAQYNAEIEEENDALPLWYILRCGLPSTYNAMELANIFYESGLFLATEPEMIGGLRLDDGATKWKDIWCDTWNVLDLKYRTIKYTTKEDFETWRYCLAHDTIIGNYTYTAVTRQTTKVPEGVYPFIDPAPEYVAAVRFTDDSKIYIYYDNTEYLLYDFNVEPGDELTVFAGINHYHSHHTNRIEIYEVERIPGIFPFGTEISLGVFPNFYGDEVPACFGVTKWVEGVGDLCGFITGADCGLSEDQATLLCAYKEGNQEYSTELEEYAKYGCEHNTASGEYTSTLSGLQRTTCLKNINENEVGTVWGSRSYLMQEIETATIDGKQYLLFGTNNTYDEYCSLWLREENNKILVYSAAQKKDLVLYDFTLNVGDSLPRLYVDEELSSIVDYYKYEADWEYTKPLFVTEVSTITLLDGKEYKKWTFDNGMEYVEGIGSFGTSYAWNDFYQLIANGPLYSDVFSQHLVCVSKNGQLLYQMDEEEMERLGAECLCEGGIGSSVGTITTPKTDRSKILQNGQLVILRDGKTYDVLGMEIK